MLHGFMNMVFSSAIKQFLSEQNPPFDDEVFLEQLSAMMLRYLSCNNSTGNH